MTTGSCCHAADSDAATAARVSREIERQVKSDFKLSQKVIQLLLLGTGESGKSTIRKQMQIIHINGFNNKERLEMLPYMKRNIRDSIACIIAGMRKLAIDFDSAESASLGDRILSQMAQNQPHDCLPADRDPFAYSQEFYSAVEALWRDGGVQRSYQSSSSYQLIDCAKYFLDRVRLFRDPAYTPSDQDILRCRVMSNDISDINFDIKDGNHNVKFRVFDVGGQRGERRKWIQCFNTVTAILYLCDVSSFDQTLKEDVGSEAPKNRLLESLDTFQEVWLNRYLQDVSILLFINKIDQLEEKIRAGRSPHALIGHCWAAAAAGLAIDSDGGDCPDGGWEADDRKKKCLGPIDLRRFICSFSLDDFQPQDMDKRDFLAAFPKPEPAPESNTQPRDPDCSDSGGEVFVHPDTVKFACYVQRVFQEIATRKRQTQFKYEYHYHACYSYFTCAVNTDNVKKVLEGCRRFIIDKHLERFGIM